MKGAMRLVSFFLFLVSACLAAAAPGERTSIGELIGRTVLDTRHNRLGEVTDVIFDARDGRILALTVDYGRALGIASYEADFEPRRLSPAGEALVLDAPEAELRRMPASEHAEWPAISAARLIGREVRDQLRRDTGEMVDLLTDPGGARIERAVIDLPDEWSGPERERMALPLEALDLPHEVGHYARLNVRRERLAREAEKNGAVFLR